MVLFLGIILSCTVFFVVSFFLDISENDSVSQPEKFDASFYENEDVKSIVTFFDYKIFRRVNNKNIIVGHDDFLFEVEKDGYNFIDDYTGKLGFTEDELEKIAENLMFRKKVFNDSGIEYVLAVIPNSQSVYGEKLPIFLKNKGKDTRFSLLKNYLLNNTDIKPVDITDILMRIKNNYPVYNNTENTINALGAYYLYKEIFRALPTSFTDDSSILSNYINGISVHNTDGRELAKLSGVQTIAKNRTLSIQPGIPYMYETYGTRDSAEITSILPEYRENFKVSPTVMIEYSNEWDRAQITPYFSNTFTTVVYKNNFNYNSRVIKNNSVSAVIQIVRESELESFLDDNVALTYNAGVIEAVHDDVSAAPLMLAKLDVDKNTVCIAGRAEEGSVLTIQGLPEKNKVMSIYGEQFIIGVPLKEGKEVEINIFASSDGKEASDPLEVTVSANPNAVPSGIVIGENSRLYSKSLIDRYMQNRLYSPLQLSAIVKAHEDEQQSIEQKNGKKTQFVYLVVPSKINVYPSDVAGYKKNGITELGQFAEAFKNSEKITVIDLTELMTGNKHLGPLCYQSAPGWTEVGAYLGYLGLMQYIKKDYPSVNIHKIEDYDIKRIYTDSGEYAVKLGLDPVTFSELVPVFTPDFSPRASLITYERNGFRSYSSHINDHSLPSAVVICDNYGEEIIDFIAEHFMDLKVLEVFQKEIDDETLKEISPDYVIKIFGEDNLDYFAK